ncbi:MAG: hypothetical protein O3A22_04400 [Bacteroidetes bacterium]|jgi:hypothetical protein|nr:hypothetical protein [Bacteroidota bacterium]MDA1383125.1 hypothetical protein [Bacteroidota bacterium]
MQKGRDTLVEITFFLRNALLLFAILTAVFLILFPQYEEVLVRLGIPLLSLLMFLSGTLPFTETRNAFWRPILAVTISLFLTVLLQHCIRLDPHEYPHLALFCAAVYMGSAYAVIQPKGTLVFLGIATICAGSVYVDISKEVISRTNGNDTLYLVKGDTVKMESYFIFCPMSGEESGEEIIFLERIPIRYETGSIVTFDDMFFKAEETHLTSAAFFSDLDNSWRIVPFPNKTQKNTAQEWKNGVAGENITASLQRNLWSTIKTEIMGESAGKKRNSVIAVRVTRYKLGVMVWFGVFLVAFGIIQLFLKRNHSVQTTPE